MLVNEMERRFGYAQEVRQARVREQIIDKSRAAIDQRVADTVEHVELLLTRYDWDDATRECERVARLFPSHPRCPQAARRRCKPPATPTSASSSKCGKTPSPRMMSIALLELPRQLDQYLTRSEAKAYEEAARDVFRKRLQQLGVQFALHVHDKNWNEALRIGRQITDEFPNTRMAAEVRERMPILEDKAQQPVGV